MSEKFWKLLNDMSEENIIETKAAERVARKGKALKTTGKWLAYNVVSVGTLIISIIALIRTL